MCVYTHPSVKSYPCRPTQIDLHVDLTKLDECSRHAAPKLEPENLLILWLSTEPSNNDGEDTGPEDIPLVGFPSTNKESLVIPIYTRSPYAL